MNLDTFKSPLFQIAINNIDLFEPSFFSKHNVGIEIQDFINLNNSSYASLIAKYQKKLAAFKGLISFHSPIIDGTMWHKDRFAVKEFHRQAIEISVELKAKYIIFHSGIDWEQDTDGELDDHLKVLAGFWQEIIPYAEKHNKVIALENISENNHRLIYQLIHQIDSPRIGICLDIGHQYIHSTQSLEEWLLYLSKHIIYVHPHSNYGFNDIHNSLTSDELIYFIQLLSDYDIHPVISLEYNNTSIAQIRNNIMLLSETLKKVISCQKYITQKNLILTIFSSE